MSANGVIIEAQTSNGAFIEDFEVKCWLQGKCEGTRHTYLSSLMVFVGYTGLSPKKLIDLADEDRKKGVRERGDPEFKILGFYDWLTRGYIRKSRGKNKGKIGISRTLASTYCNSMRSFYKANGFPLHLEIPKSIPKKENFKLPLRPPEIKRLLDATTNLRDKAIILALFQSGMSINELCNLTYRDVANGLQNNEEPLNLHLIQKKEQVEYDTFLGIDAIEALKSYLAQRKRNNENITLDSSLFILHFTTNPRSSKNKKIIPNIVEAFLRSAALKSGLTTKKS
jgi:integrase